MPAGVLPVLTSVGIIGLLRAPILKYFMPQCLFQIVMGVLADFRKYRHSLLLVHMNYAKRLLIRVIHQGGITRVLEKSEISVHGRRLLSAILQSRKNGRMRKVFAQLLLHRLNLLDGVGGIH